MTSQRLTKKAVDELQPRDKQYVCYDSSLPGFGVKVYPSGRKSFVVEYRPGSGGRRIAKKRLSIGHVGTLTCEQARDMARTKLAEVRLGSDPSIERDADRKMPTFREMAQRYLDDEAPRRLKPATIRNYEINIRRHANPIIGSLRISEIVRVDVAAMHNAIGGKSKIMANRTLETVSAVFRYAQEAGLVPEEFNPTRGVRSFKEPRRERYLSVDEFMRLGQALRLAETDGIPWANLNKEKQSKHAPKPESQTTVFSSTAIDAIRMLIFTGCRLREILHLTWKEVDLERGLLFLADSKTGARAVVLNRQAHDILKGQVVDGPFVFPSDQHDINPDGRLIQKPLADLNKPWRAVRRHARIDEVRLHDLRHSFASVGASAGMGLPIVGALLGHKQAATTERYAHLDASPLRAASDQIADQIAFALNQSKN
ncbi:MULTISPECIES: site-specific integrase [unclassified Roseitalea]|uniref:tyrosine-type recombinase/integrase n=1 Tax=unclassified Roseitalea TaxID=2639107 RepID=UPI00273E8356|nr:MULTISPECIES: site-specific integrase [unclassified Roseitalea]